MRWFHSVLATFQFELSNFLSLQRMAVTAILALFPPVMLALIFFGFRFTSETFEYPLIVTVLFVSIVSLLGMLLWATPNIYSELEGKSWIFVASRPGGRISIVLGKYCSAVLFGFTISLISITGCLVVIQTMAGSLQNPIWVWFSMNLLYFIGCMSYGAIYSLIGTLFYRRAMVAAAAYTIVSGMVLANVPAVVSRLTLRYHLQFIGYQWFGEEAGLNLSDLMAHYALAETPSVGWHLLWLIIAILSSLALAAWVVVSCEYVTSDET
ncbi:MAG: hypothetical protein VYE64_04940 [Planctomycetota bacterium]|nr:hypothetical protein [Planctomycetota bacterium]